MQTKQMMKRILLMIIAATFCAGAARADSYTFTGSTTGGPTFDHPSDNQDRTPVSLSGENVAYNLLQFSVNAAGLYTFNSTAMNPNGWDNFTLLYRTSFNPLAPLSNVLIANDDNSTLGLSGFAYNLTVNTNYFFVTTGLTGNATGAFINIISGPGQISPVPEPAAITLLGLGIASVGARLRRKRIKS